MASNSEIFIIDDSVDTLNLMKKLLENEGYTVRASRDGQFGLDSIKRKSPDLILLDVCMPHLSGYEIAKELKSDPKTASIPIIFLSGINDKTDQLKSIEAGGSDFILKPVETTELFFKVQAQLNLVNAYKLIVTLTDQHKQLLDQLQAALQLEDAHFDKTVIEKIVSSFIF